MKDNEEWKRERELDDMRSKRLEETTRELFESMDKIPNYSPEKKKRVIQQFRNRLNGLGVTL